MVEFFYHFFINDTNESVFLFLRNIKDLSLIRNGELVYHEVKQIRTSLTTIKIKEIDMYLHIVPKLFHRMANNVL